MLQKYTRTELQSSTKLVSLTFSKITASWKHAPRM